MSADVPLWEIVRVGFRHIGAVLAGHRRRNRLAAGTEASRGGITLDRRPSLGQRFRCSGPVTRDEYPVRRQDSLLNPYPLSFDRREHRVGLVGQSAGPDDPHGLGDDLADAFTGAERRN